MIKHGQEKAELNLLVVGLGLIGGSFAAAIKQSQCCAVVTGFDRQSESVDVAYEQGLIDEPCYDLQDGVAKADVVMLAVPMLAMPGVLTLLYEKRHEVFLADKVITDVGSCKESLIDAAVELFGSVPVNLVPGHPIAGSEKNGVTAADVNLFKGHKVILTPLAHTNREAVSLIKSLWLACGAHVDCMDVHHHDEVLALTSHLPHLLAFSLVDTLAGNRENQEIFRYAAGGFRDFTRIAGSDPTMWHDIALGNQDAILQALDRFTEGLDGLRNAIIEKDSQTMLGIFGRASAARQHFASMLERRAYMTSLIDAKTMNDVSQTFIARPGGTMMGELRVPGDKSVSHRSIMLGALAEGETVVNGFLEGEDAMATLQAFRDMGVVIEGPHDGQVKIHGVGLHGLQQPSGPLYLGNAGTAMRLMAGLMSAQSFDVTLTADKSLSGRPMNRVVKPLVEMGAVIETSEGGRPPLVIKGGQTLKGIQYELPVASAQVQSCLLLAGLYAEGETSTVAPGIVRDHTNRMLSGFGYPVAVENGRVSVVGGNS